MSWQPIVNTGAVWLAIAFLFLQWAESQNFRFWIERSHHQNCDRQVRFASAVVNVIKHSPTESQYEAAFVATLERLTHEWDCPPIEPPSKMLGDSLRFLWLEPEPREQELADGR